MASPQYSAKRSNLFCEERKLALSRFSKFIAARISRCSLLFSAWNCIKASHSGWQRSRFSSVTSMICTSSIATSSLFVPLALRGYEGIKLDGLTNFGNFNGNSFFFRLFYSDKWRFIPRVHGQFKGSPMDGDYFLGL